MRGVVQAVLLLVIWCSALADEVTVRAAGKGSSLTFDSAAIAQKGTNQDNLECFTPIGISFFTNWSSAFVIPPPFDFGPSVAAYGLNLLLKYCGAEISVPPARSIDPEGACFVDQRVGSRTPQRMNHIFWVPTTGATRWGELGSVRPNHMNSEVEIELITHTGQDSGESVRFPVGRHEITWRGHTLISIIDYIFVYVPGVPAGTRWEKAIEVIIDVGIEAGLIAADQVVDGRRHGVFHDEKQLLNVLDLVPPVVTLNQPEITLEANAFGGATRFFYQDRIDSEYEATDACDNPLEISFDRKFFPVGQQTPLTITAEDPGPNAAGDSNTGSAVLLINVVDTVPPVLRIPDNEVVESPGPAPVVLGQADVFDFVDDAPAVSHDALEQPGVSDLGGGQLQFPVGLTRISWTATDASGNTTTEVQTVQVKTPGSNRTPIALSRNLDALTEDITEIILEASDLDGDPLNFRVTRDPDHGSLISPLLPFFVEDYRQPVGSAPPGELYRCQPNRPSNRLAWPHAIATTGEGFMYVLDVASELPQPNMQFPDCESTLFNRWPAYRIHKLAPDGSHVDSIDLPPLGGHYFGGTLSIDELAGTLLYATDEFPNHNFLLIDLNQLSILEQIPIQFGYNESWKGILTSDGILFHIGGRDEIRVHDLRETRAVTRDNEIAQLVPLPGADFHTDIAMDSGNFLYLNAYGRAGPIYKFEPYTIDEDGNITLGEEIGWMGACNAGPGCDVANGRSRGFSCTNATCDFELPPFGDNTPGRDLGVALAIDPLDNLYVGGSNVQRFTDAGIFAGIAYPDCPTEERCFVLGDFGGAFSLFVNEHRLYTVDPDFDLVHVFQTSVISPLDANRASIKYLSRWGYQGTDTIEFTADDGLAESTPGLIQIDVSRQFRRPVAYRDRRQSVTEDTPTALALDGYDPDGPIDTLSFEVLGQPLFGSVAMQGNTWVYTPDADYSGSDQVLFRVYDGREYSEPELFAIDVQPVNDAPEIVLNPLPNLARGYQAQIDAEFTDADPVDRHLVTVDWGDGTVESEGEVLPDGSLSGPLLSEGDGQSGQVVLAHVYDNVGTYELTVCITDNVIESGGNKAPTATSLETCLSRDVDVVPMVDAMATTDIADPMVLPTTFTYRIEAKNVAPESGPGLTATNVDLEHDLNGARVLSVTPDFPGGQGSCSFTDQTVSCTRSSLGPDQSYSAQVMVQTDPGIGEGNQMQFNLEISATEPDANPENTLNKTVTIVPPADFLITEPRDLPDAAIDGVCATAETGACSLRAAMEEINQFYNDDPNPKTVQLSDGNYVLTYEDTQQKRGLGVTDKVVIRGVSPARTSLYGGGGDFMLNASGTMEVRDITLEGSEDFGVLLADFASVVMDNVIIRENIGLFGVASLLLSDMEIRNSAIVNNITTSGGHLIVNDSSSVTLENVSIVDNNSAGAILVQTTSDFEPADTRLTHVTLAGNTIQGAAAVVVETDVLELANTVLSGNGSSSQISCAGGTAVSLGGSVLGTDTDCLSALASDAVTDDPRLAPLTSLGRGQVGRLPLADSPALELALSANCSSTDARGRARPFDGDGDGTAVCDAGAIEYLPDAVFASGFE